MIPNIPVNDRRMVLEEIQQTIHAELDRMSEELRPKTIPAGWFRMQYDAPSYGRRACRAYLQEVLK